MVLLPPSILPRNILTLRRVNGGIHVSSRLTHVASAAVPELVAELRSRVGGLTEEKAQQRLTECGPNVVVHEQRFTRFRLFLKACVNPLLILLLVFAIISFARLKTRPM